VHAPAGPDVPGRQIKSPTARKSSRRPVPPVLVDAPLGAKKPQQADALFAAEAGSAKDVLYVHPAETVLMLNMVASETLVAEAA
jgi:hypothetical protein